ncbi:MAG TPA: hypothetical protein VGZ25_09520 [Gemmataceae bacterium]|nr:hypothetical protein [Gemmataceae bacterium]
MAMKENKVLRTDQDLDTVLRSYFQAEMINPWPSWQTPKQHTVTLTPRSASSAVSMRRYFALAASIALMIFGFLLVSDKLQNAGPRDPNGAKIGFKPSTPGSSPMIKENLRQNGERPTQLEMKLQER